MTAKKSVKKNYLYNLAYQILLIIVPFVTIPYLSRVLGVENIGINSFTLSIVAYFILVANIGIGSFGAREIALHQDDRKKYSKIFWDCFSLQFVTGVISTLAYIIYVSCFGRYTGVQWIMIMNIIAAIVDMNWFYRGLEDYKYISLRNIAIKLLGVAATFIFVHSANDLWIYVLINSLSLLLSSAVLWFKFFKVADRPNFKELRVFKYWKDSLIYFLPQIATSIYTVLDKTMLGVITRSEAENGYYEQTYKIIQLCLTVLTALNVVVAPRMAFLYGKGNKEEIKERLKSSFHFIFMLAFPIVLGIVAVGPDFSTIFFGDGYEKVRTLLPLFAPIVLIIAISNCLSNQLLTPIGKRAKTAIFLWVGAFVNFALNLVTITLWQGHGAAISSLIAEFVIMAAFVVMSRKYMPVSRLLRVSINYLISALAMFAVLMVVNHFWTTVSIVAVGAKILIGAATYFFVLCCVLRDGYLLSQSRKVVTKALRR
ncbi:flippase [Candidatus Saccharibacteria bacterium]|nr:flippase [Candidatus Saccharibacteria bacterium]